MKFKTDMEALILGALAEGPLHGYGIVRTIQEQSGDMFKFPESQLYPLLRRMQNEGWIIGEWEMSESGPARRNYTLSESGRAELEARRKEWRNFTHAVGVLLVSKGTSS